MFEAEKKERRKARRRHAGANSIASISSVTSTYSVISVRSSSRSRRPTSLVEEQSVSSAEERLWAAEGVDPRDGNEVSGQTSWSGTSRDKKHVEASCLCHMRGSSTSDTRHGDRTAVLRLQTARYAPNAEGASRSPMTCLSALRQHQWGGEGGSGQEDTVTREASLCGLVSMDGE